MRKSRLSQHKQYKLIELFGADMHCLRLMTYQNSQYPEMFDDGEVEADESYFGG